MTGDESEQDKAPQTRHTPYPRIVNPCGRARVEVRGLHRRPLHDVYHGLLTISWVWLGLLSAAVYFGINAVFGLLYWIQPGAISGARPGSFGDAFFFSVQTLATVGYGVLAPKSLYANWLMSVETFVSIALTAVLTGLMFARFSRPTARVMFSRVAVIAPFEGVPTLMFRAANVRTNQILEAEVTVSLAREFRTVEGLKLRRLFDLKVVRARQPLFALTWTIMHAIDESSPLYGATPQLLLAQQAEMLIVLSGLDETLAQRIHARHSYIPPEIFWDVQFEDIVSIQPDGQRTIDYAKFHSLRPQSPAETD